MNGRLFSFGKPGNPLAQILSLLVFAGLLALALIMGAFIIAVLIGVTVVFGTVFAIRAWWFRRKLRGGPSSDGGGYPYESTQPKPAPKRLIEGEYVVVNEPDAEDARRQR